MSKTMLFDRRSDPSPLPARAAVSRGKLFINTPVLLIGVIGAFLISTVFGGLFTWLGATAALATFIVAWLWWSLITPRWRSWALARGADPQELQQLAERARLVWPRGSIFERTEIPRNGR